MKVGVLATALSIVLVALAGLVILVYSDFPKGPLESTPMGFVFGEKGEKLSSACMRFQSAINASGTGWTLVVDSRIADTPAPANFGGGGSALALVTITKTFGCKMLVNAKEHLIVFYRP